MAVSPEQLLDRARELIESSDELQLREGTKTAYYAAYHLLKPLERAIQDPFGYDGGAHAQIVSVLTNSQYLKAKSLGYILRDCHIRRVRADYDLSKPFGKDDARLQVELVTRIFADFRKHKKDGYLPEC